VGTDAAMMHADAERSLNARVALVTGGSRGVGRAVCEALAGHGADVAFTYRKNVAEAEQVLLAIEATGVRALAIQASIDSAEDNERTVAGVREALGDIDILVNNAGIVSGGKSVGDTPIPEFRRLMEVHAIGPAHLCQLVLPGMRSSPGGDIVMISSTAAVDFEALAGPYSMAKCAEEALAYTLAHEEQSSGIRVNVVAPGLIDTDMGRRLIAARPDDFTELPSSPQHIAAVILALLNAPELSGARVVVAEGRATIDGRALDLLQV
jgi:NAD(P)-dependent dehydrogenase (short-subunit alcohol dehydrogenase family)